MTPEPQSSITVFILLLLIASAVAMATKWIRVPYTLALVMVGLVISPMHFLPAVHISPDLILLIFLPALLFEAVWNLRLDYLRANLFPILTLATLGVGVSVGLIALILHLSVDMAWSSALLFGSIISATDPVSVLSLFKTLGAPARLTAIVEAESLLNDGTAVVVFRIVLGLVTGTVAVHTTGGLIFESLREFAAVFFGGILAGAIIGFAASTLTAHFDDHLLEITLTTIAAYGAFLLADNFHVSPVIAVLAAGLILGNYGRERGMSPTTQVAVNSFWEYAAFVVNSLVFLLIGLEIQVPAISHNLKAVFWSVAAMLAARAVSVYGLMPLVNLRGKLVPIRWQHVLVWGGLRGSLSIALVLSLPASITGRSGLIVMVFGTVIFSLLVQGLTVSKLIRWLGLTQNIPSLKAYEILRGQSLADGAALSELEQLHEQGLVTEQVYQELSSPLADSQERTRQALEQMDESNPSTTSDQMRRRLLDVKKARLSKLLRDGFLSEESFHDLRRRLDEELAAIEGRSGHAQRPPGNGKED